MVARKASVAHDIAWTEEGREAEAVSDNATERMSPAHEIDASRSS